jgi:Zn-dependent M32 family carboxypeptidase
VLDQHSELCEICVENKTTWENFEEQIWKKLLIINGFRDPMPELSRVIEISKRLKKLREKNIKVYTPLSDDSPEITKLYRDTAWARYQKQQQLSKILKRFKKKTIHRFYPRVGERYKNFKKRRVA